MKKIIEPMILNVREYYLELLVREIYVYTFRKKNNVVLVGRKTDELDHLMGLKKWIDNSNMLKTR